ncbi:MAG: SMC-Scp complex subunit ScpB [Candidatus Aramenus sp.]|nr:SMC-Scp complex subunit ScpB [Candidatus Aramenus sp.]
MESVINDKEKKHSIKCCYKLSDTDVDVLFKLIELKRPVSSMELSTIMGVSKTTIEGSLKKLIQVGLVERIKRDEKKVGRPKFDYSVTENLWGKIRNDLQECAKRISSAAV